jgi:hypothetical protein
VKSFQENLGNISTGSSEEQDDEVEESKNSQQNLQKQPSS